MPTARKHSVIPGQPGFFHCISRCVRRAWLCGTDPVSGNNFDHRRDWMIERMKLLTQCFAMDIYAYALMENHYHLVLYIDPERVDSWSDDLVVKKWKTLWNWRNPDKPPVIPKGVPKQTIQEWRNRPGDISWVMRLLNEPMARIANAEDDTKGHFWESRFRCKPILDDRGLVTCMVYADLNPIKAGIALTPEQSEYTSIQQRIREAAKYSPENYETAETSARVVQTKSTKLRPVVSAEPTLAPTICLSFDDYFELVESTAMSIRLNEKVSNYRALYLLGIKPSGWIRGITQFTSLFRTAAGADTAFTEFMHKTGRTRRQDLTSRRLLFS